MLFKKKTTVIRDSVEDRIMYAIVYIIMIVFAIIVLYPLIYVVSCSFSDAAAVSRGDVILWPVDLSLESYKLVMSYKPLWTGYANTIFYTVVGTALNMLLTICAAYPMSRRNFQGKRLYTAFFLISMYFGGGMIPTYILMSKLHLTNTRGAIIFSGALSVYNMIVMRTFFQNSIPGDMLEAAKIDGCSDFAYLAKIILPLSKPIFAVITLYYAVGHWNSYFNEMIYLRKPELISLQLVLRNILKTATIEVSDMTDPKLALEMAGLADVMKYAMVVVSALPILCAYPFVQKYFEKGVMIGSLKG